MEQSASYASEKDAQIMSWREECAFGMGRRSKNVAEKDAQIKLRLEECALGMGQKSNYAAKLDARIKLGEEECAEDMGHIPSLMKNLLHFLNQMDHQSMKQLPLFPTNAQTQLQGDKMQVLLLPVWFFVKLQISLKCRES